MVELLVTFNILYEEATRVMPFNMFEIHTMKRDNGACNNLLSVDHLLRLFAIFLRGRLNVRFEVHYIGYDGSSLGIATICSD